MLTGWRGANEECDENFHWESVAIEQLCLRVSVNKVCSRHNFYSGGDKMTAYLGEEGWVGEGAADGSWDQPGAAEHARHSDALSCSYSDSFGQVIGSNFSFG